MTESEHNQAGYVVCDITVGWHVPCVRSPAYRSARDADEHLMGMVARGSRRDDYQVIDSRYLTRYAFGLRETTNDNNA